MEGGRQGWRLGCSARVEWGVGQGLPSDLDLLIARGTALAGILTRLGLSLQPPVPLSRRSATLAAAAKAVLAAGRPPPLNPFDWLGMDGGLEGVGLVHPKDH